MEKGLIVCESLAECGHKTLLGYTYNYAEITKLTDWGDNYITINYDDASKGLNLYFCYYNSWSKDEFLGIIPPDYNLDTWYLSLSDTYNGIDLSGDVMPKEGGCYLTDNGGDYILFQSRKITIKLTDEITSEISINVILSAGKTFEYRIVIKPKKVTPGGTLGGGGNPGDTPGGSTNRVEEKKIFYPYEVGQCLYYFDGEKIKKIVLHEFQTEVTSKQGDITKAQYNILYLKDTHCRIYTELPEGGFFTSLRDLYRYIENMLDIDSSDSDDDNVDTDLRDAEILNILNLNKENVFTKYYCDEITVKHSINTEVYTLIDGKPTNITIKSILYTKRKSLVTFEVEAPIIQYKLQKYKDGKWEGPEYIVDDIEIYSDKNELLNDIKQFEGQLYLGCDICEV